MSVNGKAVLVTDTTSLIGGATARAYAAVAADVVITGRDVQRGDRPARPLRSDGRQARFARAELAATLPLGRPATTDEIPAAAPFLGPHEASSVNGAVRAVDGGRTPD